MLARTSGLRKIFQTTVYINQSKKLEKVFHPNARRGRFLSNQPEEKRRETRKEVPSRRVRRGGRTPGWKNKFCGPGDDFQQIAAKRLLYWERHSDPYPSRLQVILRPSRNADRAAGENRESSPRISRPLVEVWSSPSRDWVPDNGEPLQSISTKLSDQPLEETGADNYRRACRCGFWLRGVQPYSDGGQPGPTGLSAEDPNRGTESAVPLVLNRIAVTTTSHQ